MVKPTSSTSKRRQQSALGRKLADTFQALDRKIATRRRSTCTPGKAEREALETEAAARTFFIIFQIFFNHC